MRTTYEKRDLGSTCFGDSRLNTRFRQILDDLSVNLNSSIPKSSETKSKTKAVYRFLKNQQVQPEKMLHHHMESYLTQACQRNRLLHIMDTVEYDYTNKRVASDLGPMNYPNRKGLYQHNSLLLTDTGAPLGLLHQSYIIRDLAHFGNAAARKKLPIEQKESHRWLTHFQKAQALCEQHPDLEIVSIADREADIMELFLERTCPGAHLLIRSMHNRKLADQTHNLYPTLAATPVKNTYTVEVINPVTKKKRKATVAIRFCSVQVKLFKAIPVKRHLPKMNLNVIQVKEINAPQNIKEPINWILLTTLPIDNLEQVMEVIA